MFSTGGRPCVGADAVDAAIICVDSVYGSQGEGVDDHKIQLGQSRHVTCYIK
jgi:hypothetical protein